MREIGVAELVLFSLVKLPRVNNAAAGSDDERRKGNVVVMLLGRQVMLDVTPRQLNKIAAEGSIDAEETDGVIMTSYPSVGHFRSFLQDPMRTDSGY